MYDQTENEDSPVHIACTQEGCDNVDVVWDWNSPQAKRRPRKPQKRLLPQSPKVPVKRYPSNNQIQNMEKLREELQALREAMAVPDHEESLILSPREEAEYKDVASDKNAEDIPPSTQEMYLKGTEEDLFNDSADEYLMLCTQRIEAELEAMERNANQPTNNRFNTSVNVAQRESNNSDFRHLKSFNRDSPVIASNKISSVRLEADKVAENKMDCSQSFINSAGLGFARTSESQFKSGRQAGKVEFHRTQSFESTMECPKEKFPQHLLNEIERKRREAIAKLESKRRQGCNDFPQKCSPEEIEKKRLQALAKLEVKRRQDIIERKRQEALKRLELSRKKNAVVVKSSLSTRL